MQSLKQTLQTLTTLEKAVLKEMSKSDFEVTWLTYYDEIDYNNAGFNKNQIAGIVSSLHKKGLVINESTSDYNGIILNYWVCSYKFNDVKNDYDFVEQIENFLMNN